MQTMVYDGRNCTSNTIPFSPEFCHILVFTELLFFQIFIHLIYEFEVFDAVGIYHRSPIIEVHQSLKIDEEIVLVVDDCCGKLFFVFATDLGNPVNISDHIVYKNILNQSGRRNFI